MTLDNDFGELAIVRGAQHSGIVRIVDFAARDQAGACLQVLALHGADLTGGALITMEPGRIRVRPPDHPPDVRPDALQVRGCAAVHDSRGLHRSAAPAL
ncbi:MAG: hypothetical protein M3O46_15615 [Myxococcota bacterium]|nr:hypothetical protein [Myxococcota bacterium]